MSDPQNKKPFGDFNNDGKGPQNNMMRNLSVVLIFMAAVIFLYLFSQNSDYSADRQISYTQYKSLVEKERVLSAVVAKSNLNDFEFRAKLKGSEVVSINGQDVEIRSFTCRLGVVDSDTEKWWEENGVVWSYKREDGGLMDVMLNLLPWVLLIGIWIFFFRRMQGGGGGNSKGIFSFGKSRAKLLNENSPKITFEDVAGANEAKYELEEVIEFLKEPTKFQRLGGKIPKGVLLLGPPGTGKTLLARAVAGEAGVPFYTISGADFVEMFVGVGASRVRDLFEQAKKSAPCLVFIDEIDAVGRHRGAGLGGGHDEREQTLNQLLVEMDGFEQNSGVIIIAATNRPDVLDPALLRPGRFDRQVVVDRPDVKGREGILKVHTRKIPLGEDVDVEVLAKGTPGFSGADLANIVNEAALFAARRDSDIVTMYDFEQAKDKVIMGIERKSLVISDKEKEMTAYHEMGHALIGKLLPMADNVHKVSIIPRGRALGVTVQLPNEDFHSKSKDSIETIITVLMAGRAAEKLVFNIYSTGASNDLQRATQFARRMVCEWGMSEAVGPVTFNNNHDEVFLGRDIGQAKDHSEQTAQLIDDEVRKILQNCSDNAEKILTENMEMLHKTSKILIQRETIDGVELDMIINGEELPPISQQQMNALKTLKMDRKDNNKSAKDA